MPQSWPWPCEQFNWLQLRGGCPGGIRDEVGKCREWGRHRKAMWNLCSLYLCKDLILAPFTLFMLQILRYFTTMIINPSYIKNDANGQSAQGAPLPLFVLFYPPVHLEDLVCFLKYFPFFMPFDSAEKSWSKFLQIKKNIAGWFVIWVSVWIVYPFHFFSKCPAIWNF